jgi:hypothetical protein
MHQLKKKDGQGTTEYIVILAIVVALAVGIFWGKLRAPLQTKVNDIVRSVQST